MECIFCHPKKFKIILEDSYNYAILDSYPVTKDHILIIPKQHREDFFALDSKEKDSALKLLTELKKILESNDPNIEGFNIGMNCGEAAGQSIFHSHIHLIPRRRGDVANPRGGVRGVIPSKQCY